MMDALRVFPKPTSQVFLSVPVLFSPVCEPLCFATLLPLFEMPPYDSSDLREIGSILSRISISPCGDAIR